ncbi:MAG: ABC transporter permease [Lutispora sp.]|nr:ABC transporter permease [Lutispora sp.]
MNDTMKNKLQNSNISTWIFDNMVTIVFIAFTVFGFLVSEGITFTFLVNELASRVFRNAFLVLSLIIPVLAGLGLNFGIVIGAMAGQMAIIIVRYFNIGGLKGLAICILLSLPLAILFGYFTGRLYNKTRGQEMIASLIVGFFADGIYQFIFLFAVGVLIKVPATHPLIKPDAIGLRTTIDMIPASEGGLGYVIDGIMRVPFVWAALVVAIGILALITFKYFKNKKATSVKSNKNMYMINVATCLLIIGISLYQIIIDGSLMIVKVPVVTGLLIIALCIFTERIMKTKLGQDLRSVGQSQHIAEVSGINVDRKRILAVIFSTVLAAWGQIIYLQNMGTLNTYGSHTQTGIFAVASLLVGGASISNASYKHALIGTLLFNSMFIMSPEIGKALFGQVLLGEYFRSFMVYGVIGVALGLYVWKTNKKSRKAI